jgi:zinc transporter ZupT
MTIPLASSDLELLRPLLSSFIAGLATTVGGLVVFCMNSSPSPILIAFFLAFAAGIMITVSIFDLFLPIVLNIPILATFWILVGIIGSYYISFIPIPGFEDILNTISNSSRIDTNILKIQTNNDDEYDTSAFSPLINGAGTPIQKNQILSNTTDEEEGAKVILLLDNNDDSDASVRQSVKSVSSNNSLHQPYINVSNKENIHSDTTSNFVKSNSETIAGLSSGIKRKGFKENSSLRLGALMCAILSFHNLPEGMSVMIAGGKSHALGLVVTTAMYVFLFLFIYFFLCVVYY